MSLYLIPGLIQGLEGFVVENLRSARRALRKMGFKAAFDQVSFFELNEHTGDTTLPEIIRFLKSGRDLGLMSEAGMPGIADPGASLVKQCHQEKIKVVPIPGPSSVFLALASSGLNGQQFRFTGYLPREKENRRESLEILSQMALKGEAQIFIETPYRNAALWEDLMKIKQENLLLCVAADLTLPTEFILTRSISNWKKSGWLPPKTPAVFILGT
jgi:16S rRNA (cytidine1402-2'-O)-methyltransferase